MFLEVHGDEALDELKRGAKQVALWPRLIALVAFIVTLWAFAAATGLDEQLEEEKLRTLVQGSGVLGVALFLVAFVAGQVLHLPGVIFIGAASFAWGWQLGGLLSWAAATVAVAVNFVLVRTVGGELLVAVKRPVVVTLLKQLHARPRLTMVVARVLFNTSGWLSATLALAGVRFRDHLFASAAGMLLPILGWAVVFDLVW